MITSFLTLFLLFSQQWKTQRLLYLKKLDGYPVIRNVEVAEEEETDEVLQMDEIDRMANYLLILISHGIEINLLCRKLQINSIIKYNS